ncbi:MAG: hypothetical protein ABWX82_09295 [Leifsonia sp.]
MRRPSPLPPPLASEPFTVGTAAALGVSRRRTRANDLSTPFRGVRSAGTADSVDALCHAYAVRMPETQYFSHATAAQLWGIPLPRRLETDPNLHVSAAPGSREPRMNGIRGHRGAGDAAVTRSGGLAVLSPSDSWCQVAMLLTAEEAIAAGDRLLGWPEPLSTTEELDAAIARFGSRRGARVIDRARPRLRARSASPRETRLRLLTLHAGFPEPELNGPIMLTAGWTTHGDLVYRRYRVLLEYDGEQHRLDGRQYDTDVRRLNDLSEDGWIVIRVGRNTADVEVIARLDRALRSRGWRG